MQCKATWVLANSCGGLLERLGLALDLRTLGFSGSVTGLGDLRPWESPPLAGDQYSQVFQGQTVGLGHPKEQSREAPGVEQPLEVEAAQEA